MSSIFVDYYDTTRDVMPPECAIRFRLPSTMFIETTPPRFISRLLYRSIIATAYADIAAITATIPPR